MSTDIERFKAGQLVDFDESEAIVLANANTVTIHDGYGTYRKQSLGLNVAYQVNAGETILIRKGSKVQLGRPDVPS